MRIVERVTFEGIRGVEGRKLDGLFASMSVSGGGRRERVGAFSAVPPSSEGRKLRNVNLGVRTGDSGFCKPAAAVRGGVAASRGGGK